MDKKILNRILYGNVDHCFYSMNKETIDDLNYKTVKTAYVATTGITFLLAIVTFAYGFLNYLSGFYIGYTLFFAMMTIIAFKVLKRSHHYAKILYYIYATAIFGLVIVAGTVFSPEDLAVTFYVLLVIIPLIYIEPPIHSFGMISMACVIFGVVTFFIKADYPQIVQYDIANTVCCFVVSAIFIAYIRNMHINNMKTTIIYQTLSQTDKLTGIFNKEYTEQICHAYLDEKKKLEPNALIMIDLDNFKAINDTLGHKQGDYVLKEVGGILKKTFNENAVVGRIGGDEFLVLIKNIKNIDSIKRKAELVLKKVSAIFSNVTNEALSCSIGIVCNNPQLALNFNTMLSRADQTLYLAKKNGKERVEFFTEQFQADSDKSTLLVIEEEEFSRAVLCSLLKSNFNVIQAEDAKIATEYLHKYEEKIDAVIIDATVPIINGCDVLSEIKNKDSYKNIAVVLLSSNETNAFQIMEIGVDGFITKPYDAKAVNKKVSDAIESKTR